MTLAEVSDQKHIVGENWVFDWDWIDINKVIALYNQGKSLQEIAGQVGYTCRDTLLLLIELAEEGKIKRRDRYIWGTM